MRIEFVCYGNICRSPTAEIVLQALLHQSGRQDIGVTSSGADAKRDDVIDPVSRRTLLARGYLVGQRRARRFDPMSFESVDRIIAMDEMVAGYLQAVAPSSASRGKVTLFGTGVRNPWSWPDAVYENVLDQIENGCRTMMSSL